MTNQTRKSVLATELCTDRSILSMDITFSRIIRAVSDRLTTWLMEINICKYTILPITKKRNTSIFHYIIFGNTLERVDDHEYLGFSISHDLRWEKHRNKITKGK